MSTRPDSQRPDDELLALLSRWLDGSLGNDELRKRIEQSSSEELAPGQRSAMRTLRSALDNAFPGERTGLERLVRETVEALAYGA